MRLLLIYALFSCVVAAGDCQQSPIKKRWVPILTSCSQLFANFALVIPAFMIICRKIYMKGIPDPADRSTLVALRLAAWGTALNGVFMTVAFLPDCVCRICEAASDKGECSGC